MYMSNTWFRLNTYGVCLILLALDARWLWTDFAAFPLKEAWSMILGYFAFIMIGVTLLIGPLCTWLPSQWRSACLSIRRDVGIFAGLCGLLHVVLVLVLFQGEPRLMIIHDTPAPKADGWLGLFFLASSGENEWPIPNWSLPGVANFLGLCAAWILFTLWLTSFQVIKKWLGTSSWKRMHLSNPLLFLLVVFHGLIYVQSIKGEPHSFTDFLWLVGVVWLVRGIGFVHAINRRRQR